ncbi:unnamed protein product [Xylocopa violacea]
MDFQDEYALQGHLAGKKHLKGLRLHQIIKRSIVVSPLPKFISTNRLLDFFAKYGPIKCHHFGPNNLIVEFCEGSSAEILLNKPVWINNVRLNIKKRIIHNNLKKPKVAKDKSPIETEGVISYDNIKHIFEDETTFDNQLANFLNEVQLTDDVIEARYESVCTQLDKIFRPIFPKCKTYRFGSTQVGLGFKECDLDIYMDIGEPISEARTNSWTMQKIFREVKKVMYRMNCAFSNIISLPKARTPIIKFCYIRTNVSCDISFKNSLAMYKNYLIKYYISLDSRIRPLMMLIKYWARHFKISGSSKISNYALVLLIIFYLQQPFVNIIPPLMELQKTCQPQLVNGWQVNFDKNTVLPPITNQSSIPELLHGFFFFYSTFKFKSQVMCPIDGKVHTEAEFKRTETLPPCMDTYKMCVREDENLRINLNKPMCIQDPIELNCNVINITYKFSLLNTFVKYCAIGAEICVTSNKNNYKDLMKTLFTTVLKTKSAEGTFKLTIIASQSNQYSNESNSMETCTDIPNQTKLAKSDWYSTVFHIIKEIFEKVFKVQIVFSTEMETKHQKMEELLDVHAEEQQTIVFHCTGSHCVWRNRKVSNIVLDPSLSCLEKEAFVSEQMLENCDKKKMINTVYLDFLCTFEKKHPLQVDLTVNNFNCDDHVFQEFMYFAKRKLVEIIKRTLLYIQQFEKCYYYLYEIQTH